MAAQLPPQPPSDIEPIAGANPNLPGTFNQQVYNKSQIERAQLNGTVWSLKVDSESGKVVGKTGWEFFTGFLSNLVSSNASKQEKYQQLSNSIKELKPTTIYLESGEEYKPTLQDMRLAKISEIQMTQYLSHSKLGSVLLDHTWQSINPAEVEKIDRTIGAISSKNMPKIRKEYPQVYKTAAEVSFKFREVIQGQNSKELTLGNEILNANAVKINNLRKELYQSYAKEILPNERIRQDDIKKIQKIVKESILKPDSKKSYEKVDPVLIEKAVSYARKNFGEYFEGIQEDLSNLEPDSYAFQIISDLLFEPEVKQPLPDRVYVSNLQGKVDAIVDEELKKPTASLPKIIDTVLSQLDNEILPPKDEIKAKITAHIGKFIDYRKEVSDIRPLLLSDMPSDALIRTLETRNERIKSGFLEQIQLHPVSITSHLFYEEFKNKNPQDLLKNPQAMHRAVEFAKAKFSNFFNGYDADLNNLTKDSPAFKSIAGILGLDADEQLLRMIKLNENPQLRVLLDRIESRIKSPPVQNADPAVFRDHLVALNSDRKAVANILHGYLVELNNGKPIEIVPTLATYKETMQLFESYFPDIYAEVGKENPTGHLRGPEKAAEVQRIKEAQAANLGISVSLISTILWGYNEPEGAVVNNAFRLPGLERFQQDLELELPPGHTFTEFFNASNSYPTRAELLDYYSTLEKIPYKALEAIGIKFPIVGNPAREIRVGNNLHPIFIVGKLENDDEYKQITPGLNDVIKSTDSIRTAAETAPKLESNINDLMSHYVNNLENAQNINFGSDLSVDKTLSLMKGMEGRAIYLLPENIAELLPLSENEIELVKASAIKKSIDPELALKNAQSLKNIYVLNFIKEQKKLLTSAEAIKQFAKDIIEREALRLVLSNGQKIFVKLNATGESFEADAAKIRDSFLDNLLASDRSGGLSYKQGIVDLQQENEQFASVSDVPASPTYDFIQRLLRAQEFTNPEFPALREGFLKGIDIKKYPHLEELKIRSGLTEDQIAGLFYHQLMKFMFVASQGISGFARYTPMINTEGEYFYKPIIDLFKLEAGGAPSSKAGSEIGVLNINSNLSDLNFNIIDVYRPNIDNPEQAFKSYVNFKINTDPKAKVAFSSSVDSNIRATPVGLKIIVNQADEAHQRVLQLFESDSVSREQSGPPQGNVLPVIIT